MISTLLRNRRAAQQLRAAIPEGPRLYAIGDIHGRLDLLNDLLGQIAADDTARGAAETTLIFLGDLVDRGPESAQVVQRLMELQAERAPGTTRFLAGNHEEVFLLALRGDEAAMRFFIKIGGRETILSYGVSESQYLDLDFPALIALLQSRVPRSHIDFIDGFEDLILYGDYAFVHAGIRPGEPLANQRIKDLRWIRQEFVGFKGKFEKVIVHGHTITEEAELLPHRIGLDTGAFASGKLTAMGIETNHRWLLQT